MGIILAGTVFTLNIQTYKPENSVDPDEMPQKMASDQGPQFTTHSAVFQTHQQSVKSTGSKF